MQQIVDRLEAHRGAKFLLQDPLDIAPPERTGAVLGSRWGVEALPHAWVLLRVQSGRAPAAGSLVERSDVPSVVLSDPVLDSAEGTAECLGDVLCSAALLGQEDRLDATPESFLGDGLGEVLKLLQGMIVGDEHR